MTRPPRPRHQLEVPPDDPHAAAGAEIRDRAIDTIRALRSTVALTTGSDDYLRTVHLRLRAIPGNLLATPEAQRETILFLIALTADLYAAIARLSALTAQHTHRQE